MGTCRFTGPYPIPKNRLENKISHRELKFKINSQRCEKPPYTKRAFMLARLHCDQKTD